MKNDMKFVTADEAVSIIKSRQRVFVHGSAATPLDLLRALARRSGELKGVELVNITIMGDVPITNPEFKESFFFNSLFVSGMVRKAVNEGRGDYIPVFLSDISKLFERGHIVLDVALVQVSEPDKHGFCSLGPSVDVARSAVKYARHVIAQVNPFMPRTHGDGIIHVSNINSMVRVEEPLAEVDYSEGLTDEDMRIGRHVAGLIEDGSTLQMGIGAIPDAVLLCLNNHINLGVHTEMFSNGLIPLIESGNVNNSLKRKHRGKVVASFAVGTRNMYEYIDDNPLFTFLEASYVNDTSVIRQNPKVTGVNSAIEIDFTGQVCADSIGTYHFSGVGGQMDFIRGAALSEGGKPIIAMRSVTNKGASKIVPFLQPGAGVVTTRAHVHYIVTEWGVAQLFGKNLYQRALSMRDIAHPDHREALDKEIHARFKK